MTFELIVCVCDKLNSEALNVYQHLQHFPLTSVILGSTHGKDLIGGTLFQVGNNTKKSSIRFFIFNTNLTFLYNINIKGFETFQQKIKLPSVGFELPTATITVFEF